MIAEEVMALDRQRAEQAKAAEQAKLNAEYEAQQKQADANQQAFLELVYEYYDGPKPTAKQALERLDECDHTAEQLNDALEALKERDELSQWLKDNPEKESRASINKRIEDAKKASEESSRLYAELTQNFGHHVKMLEQRQADREQKQGRIEEVDELFPRPTEGA